MSEPIPIEKSWRIGRVWDGYMAKDVFTDRPKAEKQLENWAGDEPNSVFGLYELVRAVRSGPAIIVDAPIKEETQSE